MQDLNTFQANYGGFDFFNVWAPPNQSEQGGDATATSNVGSYAINQTGAQALGSYRLVLSSGAPSVTPRPLTLTPGPLSRLYGGANPTTDTDIDTDTASADAATANSGLVHGDSVASVSVTSGTAVFTTTATSTSNVGQYAILGSGLSASSANYGFSFAQASGNATALTINPAQL